KRGRVRASCALIALAWLAGACGNPSQGQAPPAVTAHAEPTPPPPASELAIVNPQYRTHRSRLLTMGKIQFNEDGLARVHAPVTGRVIDVFARPGDAVEGGQRLLVIDSADLGAAKSDYAKAVADVDRSAAALQLARDLFEIKAIAQKEIREAASDHRKAV